MFYFVNDTCYYLIDASSVPCSEMSMIILLPVLMFILIMSMANLFPSKEKED